MVVLVTSKTVGDPMKIKALELPQHLSHYKPEEFCRQIVPQSEIESG